MGSKSVFILTQVLLGVVAGQQVSPSRNADLLIPRTTVDIPFNYGRSSVGRWSGGALLVVENAHSAAPIVRVFDRSGNVISNITFTIPGASLIHIYFGNSARGSDGTIAVGGSAYTNDSRGGTFVAWISSDGLQQRVFRVSPFAPYGVTVAADGTIWAAGRELIDGEEVAPHHHIIRRFDKTGKMLSSMIPKSSLKIYDATHPAQKSYLVSSRDRIGWYSQSSREYIEFALDGTVLDRVKTAVIGENKLVGGVALCDNGGLFVSAILPSNSGAGGWEILALDRQRGEWLSIPRSEKWGVVYGCDGTNLVSTTNWSAMTWLEPASRNPR